MKYIVLFGISLMFISSLHAQLNTSKDSALLSNQLFFNHINGFQKKDNPITFNFKKNIKPIDPSVLQLAQPKWVFVENINHSDIYKSSPDNMFIIKPDITILFNMPVANNN